MNIQKLFSINKLGVKITALLNFSNNTFYNKNCN